MHPLTPIPHSLISSPPSCPDSPLVGPGLYIRDLRPQTLSQIGLRVLIKETTPHGQGQCCRVLGWTIKVILVQSFLIYGYLFLPCFQLITIHYCRGGGRTCDDAKPDKLFSYVLINSMFVLLMISSLLYLEMPNASYPRFNRFLRGTWTLPTLVAQTIGNVAGLVLNTGYYLYRRNTLVNLADIPCIGNGLTATEIHKMNFPQLTILFQEDSGLSLGILRRNAATLKPFIGRLKKITGYGHWKTINRFLELCKSKDLQTAITQFPPLLERIKRTSPSTIPYTSAILYLRLPDSINPSVSPRPSHEPLSNVAKFVRNRIGGFDSLSHQNAYTLLLYFIFTDSLSDVKRMRKNRPELWVDSEFELLNYASLLDRTEIFRFLLSTLTEEQRSQITYTHYLSLFLERKNKKLLEAIFDHLIERGSDNLDVDLFSNRAIQEVFLSFSRKITSAMTSENFHTIKQAINLIKYLSENYNAHRRENHLIEPSLFIKHLFEEILNYTRKWTRLDPPDIYRANLLFIRQNYPLIRDFLQTGRHYAFPNHHEDFIAFEAFLNEKIEETNPHEQVRI